MRAARARALLTSRGLSRSPGAAWRQARSAGKTGTCLAPQRPVGPFGRGGTPPRCRRAPRGAYRAPNSCFGRATKKGSRVLIPELPATRADARKLGSKLYFTGGACVHGHVAPRLTSTYTCQTCARAMTVRCKKARGGWTVTDRGRHAKQESDRRRRSRQREASASRPRPDVCEVCEKPSSRILHWDHDHKTGAFRGWLCFGCNFALGNAKDNPATLRALAAYLEISR